PRARPAASTALMAALLPLTYPGSARYRTPAAVRYWRARIGSRIAATTDSSLLALHAGVELGASSEVHDQLGDEPERDHLDGDEHQEDAGEQRRAIPDRVAEQPAHPHPGEQRPAEQADDHPD